MASNRNRDIVERVRVEHVGLDDLFSELRDALADGVGTPAVAELFADLRTSLEMHLAREDRVYYPGLRGLRPAHSRLLATFCSAHDEFRSELAGITAALGDGSTAGLEDRIDAMARRFVMHEAAEELLLQRIDAELHGS
jgi:hypothetical protein